MYVQLESLNKKRLNLLWLNFSKDRSLSRAGTVIVVGENVKKNCALLAVYSVLREEAELCVFGEYAEWNVAFSPKTRSETVRFWRKRDIRENSIMYEDLTLKLTNFLKFWTMALSIIERCQKNVKNEV